MAGRMRKRVLVMNRITKQYYPENANFDTIAHAEEWLMRNVDHPDDYMFTYVWMRDREK